MIDCIEREAALKERHQLLYYMPETDEAVGLDVVFVGDIEAIPAADVVHVVRCRYCFYSKENGFICTHESGLRYAFPNSFCSNGTARDDAKWECEE